MSRRGIATKQILLKWKNCWILHIQSVWQHVLRKTNLGNNFPIFVFNIGEFIAFSQCCRKISRFAERRKPVLLDLLCKLAKTGTRNSKKSTYSIYLLRLAFTSDGVVVGVIIRSVERYDSVKIYPTESEAEHRFCLWLCRLRSSEN